MMLDAEDIRHILELLREKHGHGYSDASYGTDKTVGGLQAKLSIMLEVEAKR